MSPPPARAGRLKARPLPLDTFRENGPSAWSARVVWK
jgi:hypothetical protein